jgi:hypothetical protein
MSKLNESQVLYVLKPLKFNGKNYETGDPFPWNKNGCSSRRLQLLIDQRHLQSDRPDDEEEVVEEVVEEVPRLKKKAKAKKKTVKVDAIED